ncbi:MAG: S8 family serine peptidase [Alphaproteobacteria bacterium]|nr:S8 family serine peptidase [Alphaproteobacteria bacterium]
MLSIGRVAHAQNYYQPAEYSYQEVRYALYKAAQTGNAQNLQQILSLGYPVDMPDQYGDSPLCQAVWEKNRTAFLILEAFNANTAHSCMNNIPEKYKSAMMPSAPMAAARASEGIIVSSPEIGTPTWVWATLGGAAVLGGAGGIALAVAGGGGDDKPISCEPGYVLVRGICQIQDGSTNQTLPSVFKTDEYYANAGFTTPLTDPAGTMLDRIGAANAYARFGTQTGGTSTNPTFTWNLKPVTVAVLDGGIFTNHMELAGLVDPVATSGPADILDFHGTAVASLIGGKWDNIGMHGIAPNIEKIIDWQWVNTTDSVNYQTTSNLNKVINAGAQIFNMSIGNGSSYHVGDRNQIVFGTTTLFDLNFNSSTTAYTSFYQSVLRSIHDNNIITVLAAGNDGWNQPQLFAAAPLMPDFRPGGQYDLTNLFIVAAAANLDGTAANNYADSTLADYSNKCGDTKGYCLTAPVGDFGISPDDVIYSAWFVDPVLGHTYGPFPGTSAAAPVISGVAAFLQGAYPYISPQNVVQIMFDTASGMDTCFGKTGATCTDDTFGRGMVNLDRATQPLGTLTMASGTSASGDQEGFVGTRLTLPRSFSASLTAALPKDIIVLDKYTRPFSVSMAGLVNSTRRPQDGFENTYRTFMHQPVQTIKANDKMTLSFSQSKDDRRRSDFGSLDLSYNLSENNQMRFSYRADMKTDGTPHMDRVFANPFAGMREAYGLSNKQRLGDVEMTFGLTTGKNGFFDGDRNLEYEHKQSMNVVSGEIAYQPASFIKMKMLGGFLNEDGSVLGLNGGGAFDVKTTQTYFMGGSMTVQPTENWTITGSYHYGYSNPGQVNSFLNLGRLLSDSFAVDTRVKMDKNRLLGLQVSSPLRIVKGRAAFDLPLERDLQEDRIHRGRYTADLKPEQREYNIGLYYMEEREDLTFRGEIGTRLNPDHIDAKPEHRALLGVGWKW